MRTAANIILAISILFFPWWLSSVILIAACFMIPRFFEAVFYGILLDALYGTRFGLYGFPYVYTAAAVAILSIASILRKKLIWKLE